MPSTNTFLGEHEDFVLKLKIKGDDGSTQIRRVRLPRIGDGNGSVSYHELAGLVVTFTFGEGSPENFNVSLNYLDVDQDTVTICSSEELVDAIEQFSGKKVLRIDTEVKPKTTSGGTPKTSPRETSTASTSTTPPVQQTTTPRASQTDRGTSAPNQDLPIAAILSSFVGVLATAVMALQEGLSAPAGASAKKASKAAQAAVDKASNAVGKASDAISTAAGKASVAAAVAASAAASATEDASKAVAKAAAASASMTDLKPASKDQAHDSEEPTEADNLKPASKDQAAESEESTETEEVEEEPRPFIHGRHTCDSCLTTPIVGKRCHAKNLPDYDLCQNCFENYKGTEIVFEFVELDRDRAFQDRWQHRRNVILSKSGEESGACRPGCKFGTFGRGRRCGPRGHRFGPGGHRGHPGPHSPPSGHDHHGPPPPFGPPPHDGPPPPFGPPHHHGPHSHPPFGPPPHHHHGPHPGWAHMGPHVGPHVEPHRPSGFESFDDALKEAVRRSLQDVAPKEEAILAETQIVDTEEAAEEETFVAVEAPPLEEFKDAPEEEEIVVEAESLVQKPAPVPSAPVEDALSTHSSLESFPNVDPVFDDEEDVATEKPAVVERDATIASKKSEADDSFASDAVGNGDIAEAMGATLDMVAGVISEMLSEADDHNKPVASIKEAPLVSETSGAMILDSTDGTKRDDEHSEADTENEWHVVGPDDESLKHDEEIARAAEMLGSALFNSDMRSSEEVIPNSDARSSGEAVSVLSHSEGSYQESFSVASVPSTVPSIAHSWQVDSSHRDRWSTQLSQLRELGFYDESLCVEIIERLNAANIGCDADEEVSVTQVVNALLKRN